MFYIYINKTCKISRLCYNEFGDSMNIIELTAKSISQIAGLYPNINVENLRKKVSEMQIVETDVGDASPIIFDQKANKLKLNESELLNGNYVLEYYMTTFLLLMTKEYDSNLQGLRTGYFANIASDLVGNFVKETANELEVGIDMFESLRSGVSDLYATIGNPDEVCELCEANNLTEFAELSSKFGLENPERFLAPYNYLALNATVLTEKQANSLTEDIIDNNAALAQVKARTI